jgi:hypothetical protein
MLANQGNPGRQGKKPLARQRNDHARGGRGGLHEGGKDRTDRNPEEGILHPRHEFDERLVAAERIHGVAHHTHSEKDESEAHEDLPDLDKALPLAREEHEEAHRDHAKGGLLNLERHDLGRDGGPDIGTQDHPDRLGEAHQPG